MLSRSIKREMRLTDKLEALLLMAVRTTGLRNPRAPLGYIEEQLTLAEYNAASAFLDWTFITQRMFGHGNIRERFAEFQNDEVR